MNKYEKLKAALIIAIESTKYAKTNDDGGTCNFDSPTINYKKMGYRKRKTIEVIENIGLTTWVPSSSYWKGTIVICGATNGQGICRTIMAEAFSKALRKSGIESGVYYQMD